MPETMEGLLALKGIGRYTAAAVACFAFGAAEPVMDTNVRRVLGRIFAEEAPDALEDDKQGWAVAEAALPRGEGRVASSEERSDKSDAYDWNQALMDLGATVCVARNPRCQVCPVQEWCSAYRLWFAPEAVQLALDGVAERRAAYVAKPAAARGVRKTVEGERFEGSRRWFRGRIVDALRALPAGESLPMEELGGRVKEGFASDQVPWLQELVGALARDGLVEVIGGERVGLPR